MTPNPEFDLPFVQRLADLLPRESNDEVAAAIQRDARERLANEPFIDRRDPATLQIQIEGLNRAAAMHRGNLDTTHREIVEVTGRIATLTKLRNTRLKEPMNSRTSATMFEVEEKLKVAEKELEALKARAVRIETGITNAAKHLKEFLAFRPRKGYPSNLELVQQYSELEAHEREARTR